MMDCGCSKTGGSTTSGPGAYSKHATGTTHAWNSAKTKRGRHVQKNAQHESDTRLNHVIPAKPSVMRGSR